ncbi:peptide/nickel transport system permease protein [Rhodoblastus acidophilus]|uniref:ABC transporter permease n=1 Tax=Rhodoblastus acidophilus TaxID=1074 RepID=UPI0022252DA3|nr:ABC transporter permease [Rhodoblastus acidophilus]MCW2318664.1 peptide/nickel transport system permease protein [Rhodoblastus acidophilus]
MRMRDVGSWKPLWSAPVAFIARASNGKMWIGILLILALISLALLVDLILQLDPYKQSLALRLKPPGFHGPRGEFFLLGTDQFGRDVLARLVHGMRVPLLVAALSALFGTAIGLWLGLLSGYFGGLADWIVSLFIDIQISLPFILVALFVLSLFGSSVTIIVAMFSLLSWPAVARVARVEARHLRGSLFIEACRASGLSQTRIVLRHVLPNALAPVIVIAVAQVAQFIIAEASLGFFGLGIAPPEPTWGNMLSDGRNYMVQAWWLNVAPGVCVILLAGAANLFGEGLREFLDPRQDGVEL